MCILGHVKTFMRTDYLNNIGKKICNNYHCKTEILVDH